MLGKIRDKKLVSDKPEYVQLRNELFPTGINLEKL